MDPKDLFRPIHDATLARVAPRHTRQLQIEQAIVDFRNDACEAEGIISAVGAALKLRYDNPTEVLLLLSLARTACRRLDHAAEIDASDILNAFERQVEQRRP